MPNDKHSLLKELLGTVCRCGKPKQERNTFCYSDYMKLPPAMRKALYSRMGSGYEEAYAAAVRFLDGQK